MESGSAAPDGRASLRGRAEECARLEELVGDVRRGESRSLVLRGEAGIGKTALLEYLLGVASGMTVVRAEGVESEMELAYAGVHLLCSPPPYPVNLTNRFATDSWPRPGGTR